MELLDWVMNTNVKLNAQACAQAHTHIRVPTKRGESDQDQDGMAVSALRVMLCYSCARSCWRGNWRQCMASP